LGKKQWEIQRKGKIDSPPTEEEFIGIINGEGVDKAADCFRCGLKINPGHEKAKKMLEKLTR